MKKKNFKWWLTLVTSIMTLIMFGAFVFGIANKDSDSLTDTLSAFDYKVGTVSDSGKILESGKSAYTKSLYNLTDLVIKVDEETSTVTYKVVYYDEEKEFISISESFEDDYTAEGAPENAKYVRILVTPYQVDGEDVTLSIFNVAKYVNQLEVSFKK